MTSALLALLLYLEVGISVIDWRLVSLDRQYVGYYAKQMGWQQPYRAVIPLRNLSVLVTVRSLAAAAACAAAAAAAATSTTSS